MRAVGAEAGALKTSLPSALSHPTPSYPHRSQLNSLRSQCGTAACMAGTGSSAPKHLALQADLGAETGSGALIMCSGSKPFSSALVVDSLVAALGSGDGRKKRSRRLGAMMCG